MRLTNEEALKLINTLRSGTSPVYHANDLMTGREPEMEDLRLSMQLLSKGSGSVKIISGNYGVGKSFLVNAFKEIALNEDFIISSFQINNGFRLNKIDDLYYAIMHNLYLKTRPTSKVSFDDIFDIWVDNLQNAPYSDRKRYEVNTVCQELSKFNMNFARAFLSFMRGRIQRNQEMMNVSCSWLTGERNIPYELKQKYDLVGAVDKTNTLDFLKAFIKLITLLDYKGLIVFIDEIDLVINDRVDIRQSAYNNLKHLIDLSTSGGMNNVMFVFSGTQEILTDREKGFLSNTALSQRLNINQENPLENKGNLLVLKPLDSLALLSLTQKIIKLYQQNAILPANIDDHEIFKIVMRNLKVEHMVTRHYVTALIEYLDQNKLA
ncbi:BREX system ATP-binding domain-containing protein [Fusibacter bizertensis]